MRWTALVALAFVLAAGLARNAAAQPFPGRPGQPDMTLTAADRAAVLDSAAAALEAGYVYPDQGRKMIDRLRANRKKGRYDAITSAQAFADTLSGDLRAIGHDLHLKAVYSYDPIPVRQHQEEPTPEEMERQRRFAEARNYGFEKAERMAGNVGYLEIRGFMQPTQEGSEAAVAAMNFLGHTDALIIDLRRNGGGWPEMVALVISYLYPSGDRVHLNDLYFRPTDETTQYWTLPYVPGPHFDGKDVYVLTASHTGSGAEEFAYDLKNLKRATLVGDTTAGAAHPGNIQRLTEHFALFVPAGRAINPVSRTDWEGVGVIPDVAVPADSALTTAHLMALKKLRDAAKDDDERQMLEQAISSVENPGAAPRMRPGGR